MNYNQIHTFLKRSILVLSLLIGVKSFAFTDTGAGLQFNEVTINIVDDPLLYSGCTNNTAYADGFTDYQQLSDGLANCPTYFGVEHSYISGEWDYKKTYEVGGCSDNYFYVTRTTFQDLSCTAECQMEIPDNYITLGVFEDCSEKITEWGYDGSSAICGCSQTSDEPFKYNLYVDPNIVSCRLPNESNVNDVCTCDDGYSRDSFGNCTACYELIHTPTYYEQTYSVSESECVLNEEDKVSLAGKYVSKLHWVSCLPSCIVGITVCNQGDKVNDTKDGCIADEEPNPDETCGGWVRIDFIDNRGATTDYYNGEIQVDHCYNVYECQTDSSLIKYTDVSCGEESDGTDSNSTDGTDPHETDNEFDDLNSTSTTFENNVSIPMLDMNGTSSGDVAIIAKLSKINDTLFQMDETLQQGFADISDEVNTLVKVNEEGFSTLDSKIGETNSKLDDTNSKLDDVNINLEGIESKLDSIDSKLTDSRTQGDYDNFVTNEIQNSFNTFSDKGVLPFSGVVSAVPNVAFAMHGETFSLLSPEMLATVDWSIFRGFLLFLAAISGFHRVFTNV